MAYTEFVAFSCPHFPVHDQEGIDWLVEQIRLRKPRVVVALGDMVDAECLSTFAKSNVRALKREYERVNGFCALVNEAAPRARRVWLMGNHEERQVRVEHAHLTELIDYRQHVKEAKRWTHLDYVYEPSHCFTLGQVTFFHGKAVGQTACKREAIQLGVPYGLYVHGHTHRPHPVHRISLGATKLPYWHANAGTFIAPKPEYMRTNDDSQWGQAIVVGAADPKHRYAGRPHWRAQTLVRKMYWDDAAPEDFHDPHGVYNPN